MADADDVQGTGLPPLENWQDRRSIGESAPLSWIVGLGAVTFLLVSLPVALAQIPPLVDYVNHLARLYVIALHGGDAVLAQYYRIAWAPLPNLAMDVVVPPFVAAMGIYGAGKLFLFLVIALLLTGPHAIQYALLKRLSIAPFVGALFVYNESFSGGLTNYCFGVGLALWGVALWIAMSGASFAWRAVASALFFPLVYFSHLAAAGVYLVSILSFEMWLAYTDRAFYRSQLYARVAVFLLPVLLLLAFELLQPKAEIREALGWTLRTKLRGIAWTFESQHRYRIDDAAVTLTAIAGAALAAWRFNLVRLHPAGMVLALVGASVFLLLPSEIMGASGVDSRLPVAFLFVLIGFFDWRLPTRRALTLFACALIAMLAARIALVEFVWQGMATDTEEMIRSADAVRRGSKIMVAQVDQPNDATDTWLYYLPCLMTIERSSLVSLLFSNPTQQIIVVNPPFRGMTGGYNDDPPTLSELVHPPQSSPAAPSGVIYWADWPSNYDYVYLITGNGAPTPLPKALSEVFAGHHFRLYAVNRGQS